MWRGQAALLCSLAARPLCAAVRCALPPILTILLSTPFFTTASHARRVRVPQGAAAERGVPPRRGGRPAAPVERPATGGEGQDAQGPAEEVLPEGAVRWMAGLLLGCGRVGRALTSAAAAAARASSPPSCCLPALPSSRPRCPPKPTLPLAPNRSTSVCWTSRPRSSGWRACASARTRFTWIPCAPSGEGGLCVWRPFGADCRRWVLATAVAAPLRLGCMTSAAADQRCPSLMCPAVPAALAGTGATSTRA